jgi:hypothetical protein
VSPSQLVLFEDGRGMEFSPTGALFGKRPAAGIRRKDGRLTARFV